MGAMKANHEIFPEQPVAEIGAPQLYLFPGPVQLRPSCLDEILG
jgi:hypothetical protein